jgi:hypothetical protein
MDLSQKQDPEIVTYKIPRIEVYQVTDDELNRVEEQSGQVGQDLTFAVASGSVGLSFLITVLTGQLSTGLTVAFISVVFACGFTFIYTGFRWWRTRGMLAKVLAKIRSRKSEPVAPPSK